MLGSTLTFYFARHFARLIGAVFSVCFLLIAVASYFEFVNRALMGIAVAGWTMTVVALSRVPNVAEEALPFAVLYGSIAAFVVANRRLEVVVARAAGVSAWQFLLPACAVGLFVGIFATAVYNPLASKLMQISNDLTAEVINVSGQPLPEATTNGPVWVRQISGDRESIIGAASSFDEGLGLINPSAYVFDRSGRFIERIDAQRAHYFPGEWRLANATVISASANPKTEASYILATNLSPNEIKQTFLRLDSVSFWSLRELSASARRAGLSSDRYDLQYHQLLSRPILLLAMVLIAANVSLRFSRSRNLGRMIIAGVAIGFMLYVTLKIAWDLGSGGIVPPPLAAWLPALLATLAGVTVLLHLEDG